MPISLSIKRVVHELEFIESNLNRKHDCNYSIYKIDRIKYKHLKANVTQTILQELSNDICKVLNIGYVEIRLARRTSNPLIIDTEDFKQYKLDSADINGMCITSSLGRSGILIIHNPKFNVTHYLAASGF